MTSAEAVRLLQADPDLGRLLSPERRQEAMGALAVRTHRLSVGEWDVDAFSGDAHSVGLLLLEGIVSREVVVADNVSTELLGPGDLLRPWQSGTDTALLRSEVRWTVLGPSKLALLDRRFAMQVSRYPEVSCVLFDRLTERSMRLATNQAISQLTRVDRRLLAVFWHLAERWGRVSSDGVVVPLALSHRILGQLVGARRPTVSSAISELVRREELVRRDDGSWLLTGQPTLEPVPEATAAVQLRRTLTISGRKRGSLDEAIV
ncbi:MAG: hypothetical protein AVDCRST_MAG69-2432 [uncultured Solirubrobacteraceae bacterium]|uniref:HTH crp-type domain-containing protein n=1 Tax=uncultured Solirubrobacteraceae bacterium TaxID=1162706 RepID=A0A6J4SZM3_9ACTN|nr:MAG: hypothetical protein AVDCRST_MAG69-2432 [uncultured Solirubrobacteraceae bacterium]